MPPPTPKEPDATATELWLCLLTDAPAAAVALEALAWSPRISLEVGAVLVEVGGSRRLFGTVEAVRAGLERVFTARGWPLALALAPTPGAALWLARGAPGSWITTRASLRGALAALPLAALALDPELYARLHGFGVRRVQDLLRLPRAALARRVGTACHERLARAFGERPDPRRGWQPPIRFRAHRDLDFETASTALLQAAAQPLFAALAQRLRATGRGVRRCVLVFSHADAPPTRLRLGVLQPVREPARLLRQLALHLERTAVPAPVRALTLHAPRLEAVADDARDLFAPNGSGEDWYALLERLHARLGAAAVYGYALCDDHRPERAYQGLPRARHLHRVSGSVQLAAAKTPCAGSRPAWLLAEPRPIEPGRYRLESGPERIESGWWDGDDVTRDYFVARDGRGARCWVFRQRRTPYDWYLHGLFG